MKKLIALAVALALAFLFIPEVSFAAGTHTVTLTWTASVDGGVYTVYRAAGACSSSSTFASIASGVALTTYADTGLAPGQFCYEVTTVVNGAESAPSNQAAAVILPASPTNLNKQIQ